MALATDDLIRGEIHRIRDDLGRLAELQHPDPKQLRSMVERLTALALVCELATMQDKEVAS